MSSFLNFLNFLTSLFYSLQGFTDSAEKKMWNALQHIKKIQNKNILCQKTCELIDKNGVALFCMLETKYKGYKNLSVRIRKIKYTQFKEICVQFSRYKKTQKTLLEKTYAQHPLLQEHGKNKKMQELFAINQFLYNPKKVTYRKSASFSGVLQNPQQKNIEGDCNQLTTLYVLLFSQRYSSKDLNVKLLPKHVCLHFKGIDFETTNGEIMKYEKHDGISSVLELIGINILDTKDKKHSSYKISNKQFLQSAITARIFSSWKNITDKNIEVAYSRMGEEMMKKKKYKKAYQFFAKAKQKKNKEIVIENAITSFLLKKKFSKAMWFAKKSYSSKHKKRINHALSLHQLDNDIKIFTTIKTAEDVKKHRYALKKIKSLAKKLDQPKIIEHCETLEQYLKK